ncbi:LysM peptidoglycan-binding domain-containing protein [Flavobacterium psychrotolerans]|uniref:Peptidoglycan-binding protein n=1 Tax=Flavobacterium psychrotolerans TaxID=2169410 RepID=A0A2U1JRB5_9FLAO|nr:LysM peptidoglycan-binding domain-containing protein [Flavobacterium psychrotolerans]PWA07423.1 peptidoglycan-binding protein [Flavobacterium psychrotolerans]
MNRILVSFLVIYLISFSLFAQDNSFLKHTVLKGETITHIAAKYKVTPFDIYRLNPDSQAGIKENDVILIPTSIQKESTFKTHIVKSKETLYSISRDYNVNVFELKTLNEDILKDGLKTGQTIKIPTNEAVALVSEKKAPQPTETAIKKTEKVSVTVPEKVIFHVVEPGETKFGIAKKYGISVQELEQKNPAIVSNLTVGYKLIIDASNVKSEIVNHQVEQIANPVEKLVVPEFSSTTEYAKNPKKYAFANYEVKPKETFYSLTQLFHLTQEELILMNPSLADGVKEGMILKVPGKGSITLVAPPISNAKFVDLSKTIKKEDKKQLVLLLPFNASRIQGDTLKTMAIRLKKDAFLNMTLDFYSGALIAIDSAKTLGLNIDVKIFDSEESKISSNVDNVVQVNNLQNADAIIGPFYQQYVEKVAELLKDKNVPVISPLSKEIGKSYSNLYQAMPPSDFAKSAMFDFMLAKHGNIIVVSDPKKTSNKEFISKKCPSAKFVAITETGALDIINLKSLLEKDKLNYVVMDSERTVMIIETTNALLNELANSQIQMVIIEPNQTLDFDEISLKRLTILKMLYPSLTRDNDSSGAAIFEKEYKEKNKIFPSQFATRGFDVTLDTMLRLSQGKTFETSVNEDNTQQVESKFEYVKKNSNGYVNKGVYIMQYEEDLSVKQVN